MKGIILAGGSGTRLYPVTLALSKHLLPIYDKPMIYYPLSVLLMAGIREILIITSPHDLALYQKLLGDGRQFGVNVAYAIQPRPEGLAQAFIVGRNFIGSNSCALILGDNVFYGRGLSELFMKAMDRQGATIFAYEVVDPERYGIVTFDSAGSPIAIDEKPREPKSDWAVTGLYFYDNTVVRYANEITPSARGELEITEINQRFLSAGKLYVERLGRGYVWLDTGTTDSLLDAAQFVATLERRQGLKIGCPEEIALRAGFTTVEEMEPWLVSLGPSAYTSYIRKIAATLR